MKSKKNGTGKRIEIPKPTIIGSERRERIAEIIFSMTLKKQGISEPQIRAELKKRNINISKVALHRYLRELESADVEVSSRKKIVRHKAKYYFKSLLMEEDRSVFQEYLEAVQGHSMFNKLPLKESVHSDQTPLENSILQFAERVSSVITYIMIDALRPSKFRKSPDDTERNILACFENAISYPQLLKSFLAMLPVEFRKKHQIGYSEIPERDEHGNIMKDEHNEVKRIVRDNLRYAPEIAELSLNAISELMAAYGGLYPEIYKLIEERYAEFVDSRTGSPHCDHLMYKTIIHKMGERYKCLNCSLITSENIS